VIHEPIAAVVAYDGRAEAETRDKLIVVADLGGTRSDVAVIASRGGMYSILATSHDYELGGAQLDKVLVDHFAKEFIKKNKTDPRQNARSLAKLKLETEVTKKALSLGGNATISIESLAEGMDFSSTINRTRYELLATKVFNEFVRLVETVIKKAELDVLDIDEVYPSTSQSRPLQLTYYPRSSSQAAHLTPPKSPRNSSPSSPSTSPSSPHSPLPTPSTPPTSSPKAPQSKPP
jgi:molecular chaperone DnaK (HSP70)